MKFSLKYEGKALDNHTIGLSDLANSLFALDNLLSETNKILNDSQIKFRVEVKPFEQGSFTIFFNIIQPVFEQISSLIANNPDRFKDANTILYYLFGSSVGGGLVGLFELYKILKGEKPSINKLIVKNNYTFNYNIFGKDYFVDPSIHELRKSTKIAKSSEILTNPLKIEGIERCIIEADEKKIQSIIEKKDIPSFQIPKMVDRKTAKQDPIKTNLKIRMPDYTGDIKWKFIFSGKTIQPDFSNEIKKQLQDIRKEVKYNSKLPVVLGISYEEDENNELIPETEKYIIIKITGDLIQELDDYEYNYIKT